jgi:hypothetical protein
MMYNNLIYFALGFALVTVANSRELYPGQYAQYSDQERAWFKSTRSPRGVSCCDIADGHKTTWKHGDSETGYMVAIEDRDEPDGTAWVPVPSEALITSTSDPEGETVVWYVEQEGHTDENGNRHHKFYVRCFVPGRSA